MYSYLMQEVANELMAERHREAAARRRARAARRSARPASPRLRAGYVASAGA
jgi:hypothetical protein